MPDASALSAALTASAEGRQPPNVALVHFLAAADDEASAQAALRAFENNYADDVARSRIRRMRAIWKSTPGAFRYIRDMFALRPDGGSWAGFFDKAAAINPAAAVALYSLGDKNLLAQATAELVALIFAWGLLGRETVVLDFGCGTGRVTAAIAPLVKHVTAIDASPRMVDLAKQTVGDLPEVEVRRACDLQKVRRSYDTLLMIDSMPYVVESGSQLQIWEDAARLLKPGGAWLIANYSYRGDVSRDRIDVTEYARQFDFDIERFGTSDLSLWDGVAFLLRKV